MAVKQLNATGQASCTKKGQKQLTINDQAAAQPDGGSSAWLGGLEKAAEIAKALEPFIPLVVGAL